MTTTMTDRVTRKALEVRPLRAILSILAAPFWTLGFLAGVVVLVVSWTYAAVLVGFADARSSRMDVASGPR